MKSIFDSSFKYRPSFKTDLRETFLRARQELEAQILQEQQVGNAKSAYPNECGSLPKKRLA